MEDRKVQNGEVTFSRNSTEGQDAPERQDIPAGQEEYERRVLETALRAGSLLLGHGAEIFRVEETMYRLCRHYGVHSSSAFVLSNGIFLSAGSQKEPVYFAVRHLPSWETRLDRVAAVNQLSREVEEKNYTLDEVNERLDQIQNMPGRPKWSQVLAAGIACACFAFLFGGNWGVMLSDFLTGVILYLFILTAGSSLSKITNNILSGALITSCCILFYRIGLAGELRPLMMGAILPMVPGIPFTNGIRDLADGDYISGSVRMLDAILVFMSLGAGGGVVFLLYHYVLGGVML